LVWFFISLAVFLGAHIIPGLLRGKIVGLIGYRAYVVGFSLVSTVLFAWVIHEVIAAESSWLWDFHPVRAKLLIIIMLPASILWACAILQPCPLSIGRRSGFDPDRPSINLFCRHPLLLGVMLWGAGHVVANGDLVAVIFFGGSAIFALIGFWRMEKIRLRDMSAARRDAILQGTRRFSPSGLLKGAIGWRDLLLGCVIYAVLLGGHAHVIGVNPLELVGW